MNSTKKCNKCLQELTSDKFTSGKNICKMCIVSEARLKAHLANTDLTQFQEQLLELREEVRKLREFKREATEEIMKLRQETDVFKAWAMDVTSDNDKRDEWIQKLLSGGVGKASIPSHSNEDERDMNDILSLLPLEVLRPVNEVMPTDPNVWKPTPQKKMNLMGMPTKEVWDQAAAEEEEAAKTKSKKKAII